MSAAPSFTAAFDKELLALEQWKPRETGPYRAVHEMYYRLSEEAELQYKEYMSSFASKDILLAIYQLEENFAPACKWYKVALADVKTALLQDKQLFVDSLNEKSVVFKAPALFSLVKAELRPEELKRLASDSIVGSFEMMLDACARCLFLQKEYEVDRLCGHLLQEALDPRKGNSFGAFVHRRLALFLKLHVELPSDAFREKLETCWDQWYEAFFDPNSAAPICVQMQKWLSMNQDKIESVEEYVEEAIDRLTESVLNDYEIKHSIWVRETKQKAVAIQRMKEADSGNTNNNHAIQSMKLLQQEEAKLLKQQEEKLQLQRKIVEEQQQELNRLQRLDKRRQKYNNIATSNENNWRKTEPAIVAVAEPNQEEIIIQAAEEKAKLRDLTNNVYSLSSPSQPKQREEKKKRQRNRNKKSEKLKLPLCEFNALFTPK
jgi:hypothetical protein